MDLNKIYYVINQILDAYLAEGVEPAHLMTFLNADEANYKFMYNKIYRKLTVENVHFDSTTLADCLKDSVRDKIAFLNDLPK